MRAPATAGVKMRQLKSRFATPALARAVASRRGFQRALQGIRADAAPRSEEVRPEQVERPGLEGVDERALDGREDPLPVGEREDRQRQVVLQVPADAAVLGQQRQGVCFDRAPRRPRGGFAIAQRLVRPRVLDRRQRRTPQRSPKACREVVFQRRFRRLQQLRAQLFDALVVAQSKQDAQTSLPSWRQRRTLVAGQGVVEVAGALQNPPQAVERGTATAFQQAVVEGRPEARKQRRHTLPTRRQRRPRAERGDFLAHSGKFLVALQRLAVGELAGATAERDRLEAHDAEIAHDERGEVLAVVAEEEQLVESQAARFAQSKPSAAATHPPPAQGRRNLAGDACDPRCFTSS